MFSGIRRFRRNSLNQGSRLGAFPGTPGRRFGGRHGSRLPFSVLWGSGAAHLARSPEPASYLAEPPGTRACQHQNLTSGRPATRVAVIRSERRGRGITRDSRTPPAPTPPILAESVRFSFMTIDAEASLRFETKTGTAQCLTVAISPRHYPRVPLEHQAHAHQRDADRRSPRRHSE